MTIEETPKATAADSAVKIAGARAKGYIDTSVKHIDHVTDTAGEHAKGYIDAGVNTVDTVTNTARELGQKTKNFVEQHPKATIAVAAGVGAVVGILLLNHKKAEETKP